MVEKVRSPGRTISFSDALFAFAMTLLAFGIKVPDVPDGMSSAQLVGWMGGLIPALAIYALSFVVIANFWLAHHRLFDRIYRVDDRLMWMNVAFLFVISLMPFPTALLGEYGYDSAAVILYAAFMAASGLLLHLMWGHALSRNHFHPSLSRGELSQRKAEGLAPTFIFLLSMPLAVFSPVAAELSWLLIFAVKPLAQRFAKAGRR